MSRRPLYATLTFWRRIVTIGASQMELASRGRSVNRALSLLRMWENSDKKQILSGILSQRGFDDVNIFFLLQELELILGALVNNEGNAMIEVNTNALKGLKYDLDSGCISDMNAACLETVDEDEGESFSLIQIRENFWAAR